jgi:DNA-binding NarL/FixJ family response regulator
LGVTGAPSDFSLGGLFRTASAGNLARKAARRRKVKAAGGNPLKSRATYFRKRRAVQRKEKPVGKRDQVAELLAEDWSLAEIATALGLTDKAVRRHLEAIRKRLGPQAI